MHWLKGEISDTEIVRTPDIAAIFQPDQRRPGMPLLTAGASENAVIRERQSFTGEGIIIYFIISPKDQQTTILLHFYILYIYLLSLAYGILYL